MSDIYGLVKEFSEIGLEVSAQEYIINSASRDASQLQSKPLCVVSPKSTEQMSYAVKYCRKYSLPITAAGGYTGLSGGALGYNAVRIDTREMDQYDFCDGIVTAQAGASLPEIIREAREKEYVFPFQPASACRTEDVYEYLGTKVGPVTVGGSIAANASGLVGCKLGAALEWIDALEVVLPSGKIEQIYSDFDRFVGSDGRYGIISKARIELAPVPDDERYFLVDGMGIESFISSVVSIGRTGVLPMLCEGMVMRDNPPDFAAIANDIFDESGSFMKKFGTVFQPNKWLILMQGTEDEIRACIDSIRSTDGNIIHRRINSEEFSRIKQMRSAASDEIGVGIKNPLKDKGAGNPVKRAASFIAEAIERFSEIGIKPKAEHNFGALWMFLTDDNNREQYKKDIENGSAFNNGMVDVYEECNGDISVFFEEFLSPVITPDMIEKRVAVNFPGNEDILIKAEQFFDMIEVLDSLIETYSACPVPLYYCHINFRQNPGWLLVHNRLLIDVTEFV